MASTNTTLPLTQLDTRSTANTLVVAGIALTVALAHLLTNGRYGFHRDELQVLSDATDLDWGFVAYPPLTPFLERIELGMFGVSLVGLRLFSVIAQAAAVVATGLMARELGGGRWAPGRRCPRSRSLTSPSLRGNGISIYVVRLFVVGADCLFRHPPLKD